MSDDEAIYFREQVEEYVADPRVKRLTLTLLSGDKYVITRMEDIVMLKHVGFIFQGYGFQSCFSFEAICNVDVVGVREK
jgi:hypothetical protein